MKSLTVKTGLAALVLALSLNACSPKPENIMKLEGVTGSTVASYAENYCGEGRGKKANPNLWYYNLVVDAEQREKKGETETRYTVVGLQYDGMDFSCKSPWTKP